MELCKLLGYISSDVQWYIFSTSLIVYGAIGVYIYKKSSEPVLETFMFFASYNMFMFMNIIAQAVAFTIVLLCFDFLIKKKYVKYIIAVLIATTIHSSAIICLCFIPLNWFKPKRKNIIVFMIISVAVAFSYNYIATFFVNNIFSSYSAYLKDNVHGQSTGFGVYGFSILMIYALILLLYYFFIFNQNVSAQTSDYYLFKKGISINNGKVSFIEKKGSAAISSYILAYITILAILVRILSINMEVIGRFGYYFYLFSFSLLGCTVSNMKEENKIITKIIVYVLMTLFFVAYLEYAKGGYGTIPYQFFWDA